MTALKSDRLNDPVLLALQRLDQRLERAIAAAQMAYGTEAASDPYRGLYINQEQVEREMAREPGTPVLQVPQESASDPFYIDSTFTSLDTEVEQANYPPQFILLARAFDLTSFDLEILLIALAPEIDLRYERIYAYLQDDVTRRRPTLDLVLNLLCTSVEEKLSRRRHVAPEAPLIRHQLLHLITDVNQLQPSLLAHYLKLDQHVADFLLDQGGLDARLISCCRISHPSLSLEELPIAARTKQLLVRLTTQVTSGHHSLYLYFQGARGAGKQRAAAAMAHSLNQPLLVADLQQAIALKTDFEQLLKTILREVRLQRAILYLNGFDALCSPEHLLLHQQLLAQTSAAEGITILAGQQPWTAAWPGAEKFLVVDFPGIDFSQRRDCWKAHLEAIGVTLENSDLETLANRFRLTSGQIAAAISLAQQASWSAAESNGRHSTFPTLTHLLAAARAQSGDRLTTLARKIPPKSTWSNLVLPPNQLAQIRAICQQVKYQHVVYGSWGFGRKLSLGKGLNALFSGPPGTGKTMTAEVVAHELELDLYKIDLSQIVSKYIGETEKNLNHIFTAAEQTNAILFFDEADALFGKRSEVKDAHDRYANIEIAYLLQKMEEYEGITILTTNLMQNLDDAFTRRIRFIVEFPFPDAENRLEIWRHIFPKETPISADVNFEAIAQHFRLTGGNIRNIALASAFLAAEAGHSVTTEHLLQAIRQEFQKMGRLVSEEEFQKLS